MPHSNLKAWCILRHKNNTNFIVAVKLLSFFQDIKQNLFWFTNFINFVSAFFIINNDIGPMPPSGLC